MAYSIDEIRAIQEQKKKENKKLSFEKYLKDFLSYLYKHPDKFVNEIYDEDENHPQQCKKDEKGNIIKPVEYKNGMSLLCCPEPIKFIHLFDDHIGDDSFCNLIMKELVDGKRKEKGIEFKKILLNDCPNNDIWYNSTLKGINLRPGKLINGDKTYKAVTMNDVDVHGIVVGRTGSGKSVFLHNLIFNMIHEYAPWELDLYLMDFKKVELSKYVSKIKHNQLIFTPHIKTCAATSEIRYVVSLLAYLVELMEAREELFNRLKINNIKQFRKQFNVVLPRILLIVDEFQHMYQEATSSELNAIENLIMSLIKKGRSFGIHMLFCSQEMNSTISGSAIANCNIRIALQCDSAISSSILGNSKASELERYHVLINTKNGDEDANEEFQIPYINSDKQFDDEGKLINSYFDNEISQLINENLKYKFEKIHTFYDEDDLDNIDYLEGLLANKKIKEEKKDIYSNYFDAFILGNGVTYTEKKYNIKSFFVEKGKNKNIFVYSSDLNKLTYLQKLFAKNIKHSSLRCYQNKYYNFNSFLSNNYNISQDINIDNRFFNISDLNSIKKEYYTRLAQNSGSKCQSNKDFIDKYFVEIRKIYTMDDMDELNRIDNTSKSLHDMFDDSAVGQNGIIYNEKCKSDEDRLNALPLIYFSAREKSPPVIYWISGLEYLQRMDRWFFEALRNGIENDMLFILFANSFDIDDMYEYLSCCDYLFINSNEEKIYDKCGMNFTKKNRNANVIDFKIKSLNVEEPFKIYRDMTANRKEHKSIDFDLLLNN